MREIQEASAGDVVRSGLFFRFKLPKVERSGAPVVLLIHGRAGNAEVMWVFEKAFASLDPLYVAPQAFVEDPLGGFSWFPHREKGVQVSIEERTQDIKNMLSKIEYFLEVLPEIFDFDSNKMFAAGFSQGAAVVSSVCLTNPKRFHGAAMLSGFVPRIFDEHKELVSPRLIKREASLSPFFLFHGASDEILPIERAEEAKTLLEKYGARVTLSTDDVGHKVSSKGIKALGAWVESELGAS